MNKPSHAANVRAFRAASEAVAAKLAPAKPSVGDFIFIPSWRTQGLVIAVSKSDWRLGAWDCLVEARPDDPSPKTYRLKAGEFTVE